MIFEKRYSNFIERVAREIVTEKSEKLKKRKKRNRIFLNFFVVSLMLGIVTGRIWLRLD
jgi:hypothetical protein